MEQTRAYENKVKTLKQTLSTFKQALGIKMAGAEATLEDTIKSGQAQKFEVCVELFWKTIKKFMYEIHGIEAVSPKMVMKGLFRLGYADEAQYEILLEMINDRNRLSHIYNVTHFQAIHERLPEYHQLMSNVLKSIYPDAKVVSPTE